MVWFLLKFLRFSSFFLLRRLSANLNYAFRVLATGGGVASAPPCESSISFLVSVFEKIRTDFKQRQARRVRPATRRAIFARLPAFGGAFGLVNILKSRLEQTIS